MISVREIQSGDIEFISQYWLNAADAFLIGMGVDLAKMPSQEQWHHLLSTQLSQSYPEKQSYCTIWELDGHAVGHCNVNKIVFGDHGYMHLHLWQADARQRGIGTSLVKMSLPYFFENLQLKKVYCEPFALNPAPNKTLEKVGFQFIKSMVTIPGFLNFKQEVNVWELKKEQYLIS